MESTQWITRPKNLSAAGIHDDETARALGFAGGFVPGVTLYEHVVGALLRQGRDWLHEGSVAFRFRRPVYDGEEVRFTIDAGASSFAVTSLDRDEVRASGHLDLLEPPPVAETVAPIKPAREPLGSAHQIGLPLQIELHPDPERAAAAAALSGFPQHDAEGALVPVGLWLNPVDLLRSYFDCPVTVHYAGRAWHHSPVYAGETLVKRGAINWFEERNGNRIVAFTAAITTADGRPVATVEHRSVYELARAREVVR